MTIKSWSKYEAYRSNMQIKKPANSAGLIFLIYYYYYYYFYFCPCSFFIIFVTFSKDHHKVLEP